MNHSPYILSTIIYIMIRSDFRAEFIPQLLTLEERVARLESKVDHRSLPMNDHERLIYNFLLQLELAVEDARDEGNYLDDQFRISVYDQHRQKLFEAFLEKPNTDHSPLYLPIPNEALRQILNDNQFEYQIGYDQGSDVIFSSLDPPPPIDPTTSSPPPDDLSIWGKLWLSLTNAFVVTPEYQFYQIN